MDAMLFPKISFMGASTIKGASRSKVQILSKDYVFSSLKHGLHVLVDSVNFKSLIHMCFHEFSNIYN
jgi:hypothetical protein